MDCWLYKPLFFAVVFLSLLVVPTMSKECRFEYCTDNYRSAIERTGMTEVETNRTVYCPIMQAYIKCMRSTEKACRGNIGFHGTLSAIRRSETENCQSETGGGGRTFSPQSKLPPFTQSVSPPPSCKYFGTFRFRHCGLFGDPHLKTFEGIYQTCRVLGTWVLIDNPYMSVHVTNQPVVHGSLATAPTKISIVVKGRNTPCTLEKRYEADSESTLPITFTDQTDRSGPDNTVVLISEAGKDYVEIVMKYIASRLIVRKVGRYLAFSAKLPEDVFQTSKPHNHERLELCSIGCPASEQLDDRISSRLVGGGISSKYKMTREEALQKCTESMQSDNEVFNNNLTDNYLDWCVFDLMTTGSTTYDFVAAAHVAQNDAIKLDPSSLKNRTTLPDIPLDSDLPPSFIGDGGSSPSSSATFASAAVPPDWFYRFCYYCLSILLPNNYNTIIINTTLLPRILSYLPTVVNTIAIVRILRPF